MMKNLMLVLVVMACPLEKVFADIYQDRIERIHQDQKLALAIENLSAEKKLLCSLPEKSDLKSYWWHCMNPVYCRYGVKIECLNSQDGQVEFQTTALGMDDSSQARFQYFTP